MRNHGAMVEPPYDPWTHARALGAGVHVTRLPDGYRAVTDCRRVWLDDRLTAVEARCALAHELVHVEFGHDGPQPETIERQVTLVAARRLIPWGHLTPYLGSQYTPHHVAEDLGVTEETVHHRIHHATLDELADLHHTRQGTPP